MFYLRKEAHEKTVPAITKTDGEIIPERTYIVEDRAIYKHKRFSRFYRKPYPSNRDTSLKLYKVKSLKRILALRKSTFDYSGEWFDVYDDNGKVDISEISGAPSPTYEIPIPPPMEREETEGESE